MCIEGAFILNAYDSYKWTSYDFGTDAEYAARAPLFGTCMTECPPHPDADKEYVSRYKSYTHSYSNSDVLHHTCEVSQCKDVADGYFWNKPYAFNYDGTNRGACELSCFDHPYPLWKYEADLPYPTATLLDGGTLDLNLYDGSRQCWAIICEFGPFDGDDYCGSDNNPTQCRCNVDPSAGGGASLSELGCQDMKGEYNSRCPCEA